MFRYFLASALIVLVVPHISLAQSTLAAKLDDGETKIEITRSGDDKPVVTQITKADFRPYLHPIVAPDGIGELTEFSPGHHKHQTGLYWGFTRVNGRDYFHHPESTHWKRVSVTVLKASSNNGGEVQWQTVYDMLRADGKAILRESQIWTMRESDGTFELDLQWNGKAFEKVTIGKYDYGGLFLRMPWKPGIKGRAVNSARQINERAEGQRSVWLDVGMQVPGRDDMAHIAIFDHPSNPGSPLPWRVDGQLGIGPVRARMGDWNIAPGETATIQHRLLVHTGLSDDAITKKWSEFSGQDNTYAEWWLAQEEGRKAKFLKPEEALAACTVKDGFDVNLFASEPMITQPMAFCWDEKGRMWVAENRDYESRGHGFSNFGDSRILILEDTDHDGVADKRSVFLEGIPFPSAIAVGNGGLWLGAPPNLLFVPDANGDDKADDDIEVRLTGWGIKDRHETVNSLHWGPDGWLYGCQGLFTPSRVGKPKGAGKIFKKGDPYPEKIEFEGDPEYVDGGVWRYHPYKDRFEIVAHGFSNPWGIDYDDKGQLFITACVIPHLWHVIPGGVYHRQGGKHINPYVYQDIKTIADHRHRSAHGGARIYQSDAFPKKYHGRIFMCNIHEHAILTDILEPAGSGYVGRHGDDFMLANNAQWVGFGMEIGPDGAVYALDWHDSEICGNDVKYKDTGRVFRVAPGESAAEDFPGRYDDISKMTDLELVAWQKSKSAWHARTARTVLQHRAHISADTFEAEFVRLACQKLLSDPAGSTTHRLRALWTLHITKLINPAELRSLLADNDPYLRAWAIQLICEDRNPMLDPLLDFIGMSENDPSAVVRLHLASAAQRIEDTQRWDVLSNLAMHAEDTNDHNLPKMIWFGLEPLVCKQPEAAIELAAKTPMALVARHIARRLVDGGKEKELVAGIRQNPDANLQLLLGMRDALEGQFNGAAPEGWRTTAEIIEARGGESARIAMQLSQQFGDAQAAQQMIDSLKATDTSVSDRKSAMSRLAGQKHPALPALLLNYIDKENFRIDAIRAMASYNDDRFSKKLLSAYDSFPADAKLEAVQTLAARTDSGRHLTEAIAEGKIPKSEIPPYVARVLRRSVGQKFIDVWGPIDGVSMDKEALFTKYRTLLSKSTGNEEAGHKVFTRTCATCHKLYDEGKSVGPDITGANRSSLDYLLGNILTPSAEIQDAYRMHMVLTDDGRLFSGIPIEENERQLKLHVANQEQPVVINKAEIESQQIASVSMMPDGLLSELTEQEVIDLFTFLQTTEHTHEHK